MTVIGIDVGGTYVKAGVVDGIGRIVEHGRHRAGPRCATGDDLVALLTDVVEDLRRRHPVEAVGIGVAGLVRHADGVVTRSPNYPQWRDVPLRASLRQAGVDLPVHVDNDANVVALGEARHGAAQGCASFVLLTLGTGVGGALVLDGRLWRGVRGFAGELGHIVVDPDGRRCGCGSRGCLEQYASRTGLRNWVREHALDIADADALANRPDLPEKLAEMARTGDRMAMEAFQQLGRWLGLAVASLLDVLDVGRVVVAGGLAASYALFGHALAETVAAHAYDVLLEGTRIVPGQLGDAAGVLGAAVLTGRL